MPTTPEPEPLWSPAPHATGRRGSVRAQTRFYDHPRWDWARRRRARRGLIATYLVTLAGLTAVGWVDAQRNGVPGFLTGKLWFGLFVAILVEQVLLEKATRGLFRLRADVLDERQRAVRDLGYRYGFRILAAVATVVAVAAVWLPTDRLLRATSRLEWVAVAVAVVYLLWMLPTMVVAWIEPDGPALDEDERPSPAAPAA
jgi:hypothetical protein